jgi:hypothetical protein
MRALGWIFATIALFAGLTLWSDHNIPAWEIVAKGLFVAAFLCCPMFWGREGLLGFLGIGRGQRIAACIAGLLALPVLFVA